MGKKSRQGARKDGTAAPAEKGGQTAGMRKEREHRGNTSRADARKEQVGLAWSETVGELKGIIENSGMRGVINAAVDADEFRDVLALWQSEMRRKGIKQEIDGLPFPTSARIAFNPSSETGAAPCKHDVEHWVTDHPLLLSGTWSVRSGDPSLFVLVGTMTGTAQEPGKTANKGGVKRAIVHRRAGEGGDEMSEVGEQHLVNSSELGKKLVGKCGLSVEGGGNPVGSRLRMAVVRRTRCNGRGAGALRRRRPLLDTEDQFEAGALRRVRIVGRRDVGPRIR